MTQLNAQQTHLLEAIRTDIVTQQTGVCCLVYDPVPSRATLIRELGERLKQSGKTCLFAAPTKLSAQVLGACLGRPTSTIQALLRDIATGAQARPDCLVVEYAELMDIAVASRLVDEAIYADVKNAAPYVILVINRDAIYQTVSNPVWEDQLTVMRPMD